MLKHADVGWPMRPVPPQKWPQMTPCGAPSAWQGRLVSWNLRGVVGVPSRGNRISGLLITVDHWGEILLKESGTPAMTPDNHANGAGILPDMVGTKKTWLLGPGLVSFILGEARSTSIHICRYEPSQIVSPWFAHYWPLTTHYSSLFHLFHPQHSWLCPTIILFPQLPVRVFRF